MSEILDLPADQQDLIRALPYRVGMYVSYADMDGGEESASQEHQACEAMITAYVEDFGKSEFVQGLMEETLKHQDRWSAWAKNLESVPDECARAVKLLQDKVEEREITLLGDNLLEIGFSVAQAYRESGNIKSIKLLARLKNMLFGGSDADGKYANYVNVSAKEWEALSALALSLGQPLNPQGKVA